MTLTEFKSNFKLELKQRSLVFLMKENKVLLGFKKTGFGQGKILGIGGKQEENETILETAIRETKEEIGATPLNLEEVATINFYFEDIEMIEKSQQVVVYICKSWLGEITESNEILPKWFNTNEIPYILMWDDYKHWFPKILKHEQFTADFLYDKTLKVGDFKFGE